MRYIFVIILLVLSLIFAFQNTQTVSIKFLLWGFNGSQALITILTFFVGAITGLLIMAQRLYAKNAEIRKMRKQFLETGKFDA